MAQEAGGSSMASSGVSGAEYRVRLEDFQGPLDLLLHLVRRAEVDPGDIPVAQIADQYLDHLERATRVDVEVGGEFLVMAATLMEIKSRSLMPPEDRPAVSHDRRSEGDPRSALIRQLLAYRQFRDAADALDARREAFHARWPLAKIGVDREALRAVIEARDEPDLEDLDILDLVESFARVAAAVNFDRLGEHTISFEDTPIELHATDILDRLGRLGQTGERPRMSFRELFAGASRSEIIGLFIATLELTRQRRIVVETDEESGMIMIEQREPDGDDENAIAPIPAAMPVTGEGSAEPGDE
ncbi:MAG: segregation and condensation protein A [Phycisphaerales bacterium]